MTEQEQINVTTQRQLALQDAKFNAFVEEMREFKNDMKAAQIKHDADMKEIRTEIKEVRAEVKEIRAEIRGSLKHMQNLTLASMGLIIAAVVGILAIAVAVIGFLWTTANNMQPPPQPTQTQSTYQVPPNQQPAAGF